MKIKINHDGKISPNFDKHERSSSFFFIISAEKHLKCLFVFMIKINFIHSLKIYVFL